ncbi:class I poly(R)-hydroxyalkanoic acid synthase [Herbaspirillum sp. RTI4]|uniref:PHA/PHB synthase family protein n=1 Tax=Herbaspirillum sp. RTI4 TaxID=3048640 RepID=UPI002AB3973B|nr:class I poly(R)-hydroxyalkanoic acid synthase [Herbaspirillum sp. RTI4]MDY7578565.1 class I poly(R)-hydroxyalkanoic acid synthase [Herbaspirillum sp. RTI4]MEA9981129.1 class I poly(R)-hydroxyalkanoic acid synthase [Herbaspirillum sp. RTI4]
MSMDKPDYLAAWLSQYADPQKWNLPVAMPSGIAPVVPDLEETLKSFDISLDQAQTLKLQQEYIEQYSALCSDMAAAREPALTDKRFSAPAWHSSAYFAFQAASYQLNAHFLNAMAETVQAQPKVKQRIRFAVQQMVDALSPANFLATNPDAQQKIIDTQGESLTQGITQMIADMGKGHISLTDETAFEIGKNVATTAGAVVFENPLFQLIQYAPLTKTVHQKPLLIVPPCINKFYILDLQPQNSLVRYAVEQGHTVFLVSWRNADASLEQATWDDYISKAAIEAIHVVQNISGQAQINALGFCVGGTILSCALAALYARGEKPLASLTLLTAFLDFSDVGAIDVYIDEMQLAMREQKIGQGGLMAGGDFSSAFSSLRPNDLLWNYVESNYLKGEAPTPFDLLYWNADSTNLPGPMFCYYLRQMYLENALKTPNRLTMTGESIDLRKIDAPCFIYASREDHIVPWKSAYASTSLLNPGKPKKNRFVLGASGHIAGVINPPPKNKRCYWINEAPAADAESWLAGAEEHPGSWWGAWSEFLSGHAGKMVAAPRKPGAAAYPAIESAPGRYVKVRAV